MGFRETILTLGDVADATAVPAGTTDVQGKAGQGGLRLMGYAVRESAGTPAVAEALLRHGTAATDPILAFVELAGNGKDAIWFGPNGIRCPNGVFVDRVAGNTEFVLYTAS